MPPGSPRLPLSSNLLLGTPENGWQPYSIVFMFPHPPPALPVVSWKRSRNLETAAQLRPGTEGFWDPAGACCALRTPRETAGRDHVSSRGGGRRRSAPARPRPPRSRSPPLAGGCELRLVKPSPGIYRSLERNEVAFGEGGEGGGPGQSQRPVHGGGGTFLLASRSPSPRGGSGGRRRQQRRRRSIEQRRGGPARSARPGPRIPTLAHQLPRLTPPRPDSGARRASVKLAGASSGAPASSVLSLPGAGSPAAGSPASALRTRLPDSRVPAARTKP